MANKKKSYSAGCFVFILLCILSAASVFLPYISGGEMDAVPVTLFTGNLNIFSVILAFCKLLPLFIVIIITLLPFELIKKYVLVAFFSLWLCLGEVISEIIMLQYYEGAISIGFIVAVLSAVLIMAGAFLFTKNSSLPKKHKDLVWYRGLNKIILLVCTPVSLAFTVGIIFFADIVFGFAFHTVLGILLIWATTVFCAVVSILTLFERYKTGMLYYMVAFICALGVVLLSWSTQILSLLIGAAVAAALGFFWLYMGSIVKKYF